MLNLSVPISKNYSITKPTVYSHITRYTAKISYRYVVQFVQFFSTIELLSLQIEPNTAANM